MYYFVLVVVGMIFFVEFNHILRYLYVKVIDENLLCHPFLANCAREKFANDVHSKTSNSINKIIMTKEMMEKQVWR